MVPNKKREACPYIYLALICMQFMCVCVCVCAAYYHVEDGNYKVLFCG